MARVAAASVVAAHMTFCMAVMTAHGIRIIGKCAFQEGFYLSVCVSHSSRIKLDAGLGKCISCAAADTAADQRVHVQRAQNTCQCAVAAAVGIYHLGRYDLPVFRVVDLELPRVAKVLKNFSVFVSDRNSHDVFSFWFCMLLIDFLFIAIGVSAGPIPPVAELVISTLNSKRQTVHQYIRQFLTGAGVDLLDRGAAHLHEIAALFLGESLFVDETDSLVLIHRQDNCPFSVFMVFRQKCQRLREITHAPVFLWPWHRVCLLSVRFSIKTV